MTDEEAQAVIRRMQGVDGGYGVTGFQVALVKAGYRAGLEEARNTFVDIRRKSMAVDACEHYGRWLDGKVEGEI